MLYHFKMEFHFLFRTEIYLLTRMHSSRMRTGRSLTVCRGGVPAARGGARGVCRGGGIPACTEADPPVNRITDRCKNITLATTSLRPVIKLGRKYNAEKELTFRAWLFAFIVDDPQFCFCIARPRADKNKTERG